MDILRAQTPEQIEAVRCLFREYAQSLQVDLCFQGFEAELASLPGKYAPPGGALFLAYEGTAVAGCVAVRPLTQGACEMKRLFVRPQFRGRSIGRRLAQQAVDEALTFGYRVMRLDTLDRLQPAMRLYADLGFQRTDAYYHNPLPGVVYWELALAQPKSAPGIPAVSRRKAIASSTILP